MNVMKVYFEVWISLFGNSLSGRLVIIVRPKYGTIDTWHILPWNPFFEEFKFGLVLFIVVHNSLF